MGSQVAKMGSESHAPRHARRVKTMVSQKQNNPSSKYSDALMGSGGGIGKFNSLARQPSIYLDEFQNAIPDESGKNFGSMNLDELLKNMWTVEENQAMASAMAGAGGGGSSSGGSSEEGNSAVENGGELARQPSLSLPRTSSGKTIDDLWRDIHGGSSSGEDGDSSGSSGDAMQQQRQTTLGEMTLADFLLKADVVRDEGEEGTTRSYGAFSPYVGNSNGTNGARERGSERGETMGRGSSAPTLSLSLANALTSPTPPDTISSPIDAYNYGQAQQQQAQQQTHQADWFRNIQQQHMLQAHAQAEAAAAAAYENAMLGRGVGNGEMVPTIMAPNGGYAGTGSALAPGLEQMAVTDGQVVRLRGGAVTLAALAPGSPVSPASDGSGLRLSPAGNFGVDGSMRGRKRRAEGSLEKVEWRQRRMINNRESAARSRARKQAYIVELEAEVTQLKEENSKVRKQQEEESLRLNKMVLDSIKKSGGDDTKRPLRRTKSDAW